MVVQAFINLNPQFPSGFGSSAGIVENDGQNKAREKSLNGKLKREQEIPRKKLEFYLCFSFW